MRQHRAAVLRAASCLLALACLLAPTAARAQTAAPPPPAPTLPANAAEMLARLSNLPNTLPGWAVLPGALQLDSATLGAQRPLDAERSYRFDLQWSLAAELLPPEPKQKISVAIFRMAEDLDAFGLFSYCRSDSSLPADLPVRSYWSGDELHVWRGAFYLRFTPALSGDKVLRAAVIAAGQAIAAMLPLPDTLPPMLRLMPQGRNLPHTLRYFRRDLLGQTVFADGLVDTYLETRETLGLVLLRAENEREAAELFDRVMDELQPVGAATAVPDLGQQAQLQTSALFGLSYAMRQGRYVVMALGVHDQRTAEALLRLTGTNIRTMEFQDTQTPAN